MFLITEPSLEPHGQRAFRLHFEERNLHACAFSDLSTGFVNGFFILSLISSPVGVWRSMELRPAGTN